MSSTKKTSTTAQEVANESTTTVTAKSKSATVGAAVKKKTEPVMYLGPNIKGVAFHCDIYSDGVGPLFEEKIKKVPILKELLIPVTQAGKALTDLKTGGDICRKYQAAETILKESEKGDTDGV